MKYSWEGHYCENPVWESDPKVLCLLHSLVSEKDKAGFDYVLQAKLAQEDFNFVASGALMSCGPGRSFSGRLNEFRQMLVTAGKLYERGNVEGARQNLLAAGARTDGFPQPPDFMTGEVSSDLARHIQELAGLWRSP
jgi:hypothetical protein